MIFGIVSIMGIILVVGYIINSYKNKIRENDKKMSFRESMDLAELPVVTFYQGNKKFNFLLDTGSNYSHISKETAKKIKGKLIEDCNITVTGLGKGETSAMYKTTLTYKNTNYDIDLHVTKHLTDAFNAIKNETGVQVHGIIGNQFFQEYKYILDFEKLVAYSKK